jgi:alkylation response protein AidB-like acyl-CoA dehydrogenase
MILSEQDRMFRESLREFLQKEVEPDLPEADREPMDKEEAVEYQLALGELGVGPGAGEEAEFEDPVTYAVVVEEIARVWPSLVMTITMGFPFPAMLVPYAGERTRDALADEARAGEVIGCLAVTEPEGGSDNTRPSTTARREGDEYVIDGSKTWVSNATIADVALVLAWDEEAETRDFFVVDAETAPFETRELEKLGWKASPTGEMFFDGCRVPVENKLTNVVTEMMAEGATDVLENPIFRTHDPLNAMFSYMRVGMSSIAVGTAQAAFEAALDYASEREVGGDAIASKQMIQETLYEMKAGLTSSRLLTHHAAQHLAEGHEDARMLSSLAKGYSCERAVEVTSSAVQIHGANGLSPDYPVERYFRDARTTTIPDGTTEIQKLVVGSELTGHNAY